jgi:hypothetical protein
MSLTDGTLRIGGIQTHDNKQISDCWSTLIALSRLSSSVESSTALLLLAGLCSIRITIIFRLTQFFVPNAGAPSLLLVDRWRLEWRSDKVLITKNDLDRLRLVLPSPAVEVPSGLRSLPYAFVSFGLVDWSVTLR